MKSAQAIAFYNKELQDAGATWRVTLDNVDILLGNVFFRNKTAGVPTGIKLDGAKGNVFEQTEIHATGTGIDLKNSDKNRFKDTKINPPDGPNE